MTDSDRRRAVEMADAGLGSTAIARELGRNVSTVSYYLSTQGLTRTIQVDVAHASVRGDRVLRRFTREEDAFMQERRVAGDACGVIARLCTERFGHPRTARTVAVRLTCLASLEGAGAGG